jgi:Domain of unknown function (DUF4411)
VYVIDASALSSVEAMTTSSGDTFNVFTDLVQSYEMVFCNEVIDELARTAAGDEAHVWARAIKDARADAGAPYTQMEWVMANVEDLLDANAEDELSAPWVLAQARYLSSSHTVQVVTEDTHPKPTRMALSEACDHVGIPWLTLHACLGRVAIQSCALSSATRRRESHHVRSRT